MPVYRVDVQVMPRPTLLDPEGQAVAHALDALGFASVAQVRVGKSLALMLNANSEEEARAEATAMCQRLLANPVTEDFELVVEPA